MTELLHDPWLLLAAAGLAAVLLLLARRLLQEGEPPYEKRDVLLGSDERRLYASLRAAAGEQWVVLSMVRLSDLIQVIPGTPKRQSWQNRINSRHADFVICDPTTFEPKLIVALDRRRKKREPLAERDQFLDRALAAAGLPVLRIKADAEIGDELSKRIDDRAARKAA